jgi:hypothetical protein
MTGQAHWFVPVAVLVGAAAVVALVVGLGNVKGYFLRVRDRIVCPVKGRIVDVTLVEDVRTGKWVEVTRCSAWGRTQCSRACLPPLNAGESLHQRLRIARETPRELRSRPAAFYRA